MDTNQTMSCSSLVRRLQPKQAKIDDKLSPIAAIAAYCDFRYPELSSLPTIHTSTCLSWLDYCKINIPFGYPLPSNSDWPGKYHAKDCFYPLVFWVQESIHEYPVLSPKQRGSHNTDAALELESHDLTTTGGNEAAPLARLCALHETLGTRAPGVANQFSNSAFDLSYIWSWSRNVAKKSEISKLKGHAGLQRQNVPSGCVEADSHTQKVMPLLVASCCRGVVRHGRT